LEGRDFRERLAWIAALNAASLRQIRRDNLRLILTYAPEAAPQVRHMMRREQECCAFLTFYLRETSDTVELAITVPDHASEAADALLEPFHGSSPVAASVCCGGC
jgi:hypothetical protein